MKKKITALATVGLLALAVPAVAAPHYTPAPPQGSHHCLPRNAGYNASGTLVNSSLTAEEHHRYSGTLEVNLAKANTRPRSAIDLHAGRLALPRQVLVRFSLSGFADRAGPRSGRLSRARNAASSLLKRQNTSTTVASNWDPAPRRSSSSARVGRIAML